MRSLRYLSKNRISSPEKFWSVVEKEFCNRTPADRTSRTLAGTSQLGQVQKNDFRDAEAIAEAVRSRPSAPKNKTLASSELFPWRRKFVGSGNLRIRPVNCGHN
jgi:hypothetical protein